MILPNAKACFLLVLFEFQHGEAWSSTRVPAWLCQRFRNMLHIVIRGPKQESPHKTSQSQPVANLPQFMRGEWQSCTSCLMTGSVIIHRPLGRENSLLSSSHHPDICLIKSG